MATKCIVRLVTTNEFTVELTGPITVPPIPVKLPSEDMLFSQILKIIRTNIQGRLMEPSTGVVEMIASMVFALRWCKNPPTRPQVTPTPLPCLIFSWGTDIKPNLTMTSTTTTEANFTFNVHYAVGTENINVPVVVNRVTQERELNVQTILTELERKISCPRPYLMSMLAMLYCLCCVRVTRVSNVEEFTRFNIHWDQK